MGGRIPIGSEKRSRVIIQYTRSSRNIHQCYAPFETTIMQNGPPLRAVRERVAKEKPSQEQRQRIEGEEVERYASIETSINQSAHVESRGLARWSGASLGLIKLQIVSAHVHAVIKRVTRITLSTCISKKTVYTCLKSSMCLSVTFFIVVTFSIRECIVVYEHFLSEVFIPTEVRENILKMTIHIIQTIHTTLIAQAQVESILNNMTYSIK